MAGFVEQLRAHLRPTHDWLGPKPLATARLRIGPVTSDTIAGYARLHDGEFARLHRHSPSQMLHLHRWLDPHHGRPVEVVKTAAVLTPLDDPTRVIGFVSLAESEALPGSGGARVLGLHVERVSRGNGYMSEALAEIVRHLVAEGFRNVWLVTSPDNEAMIAMCTRLGFRLHDHFEFVFPDGSTDEALAVEVIPSSRLDDQAQPD